MPPWWLPLVLLAVAFLGEGGTWRGYRRRIAASPQDRSSLRVNNILGWFAFASGLGSGAALRGQPIFALPDWLAWSGVIVAFAGIALRVWAIATLGSWFTLTVQVRTGQPVVQSGPYRVLRHPSYCGGEVMLLGVGLSSGNWLSPALFLVPWIIAHVNRIRVEERALLETLGETYRAYCQRTWRLVPFIW